MAKRFPIELVRADGGHVAWLRWEAVPRVGDTIRGQGAVVAVEWLSGAWAESRGGNEFTHGPPEGVNVFVRPSVVVTVEGEAH